MKLLMTGLMLLALAACGKKDEASETVEAQPEQTLTEAVHQPLDKAKGVEQLLQDSADKRLQQNDGL